ncbi:hypothetical protein GUITHDRAFT_140053 [Guillardia theta CCMP2712]|uniref:Uncharacterized protein n=1 Tax=Guillardia theta (strain CCMP2712) TaxID=905079 RepID=L1J752_GUITC|nr:hypothetical protein GUITHDRAFT_140053 [Guillardia theta CCMP2712]EKX43905.1 hypothetical protein GUITHDRAFT_140053 [Guillardia theta CCMP2712]|eukprot:XP_005830885.1 hypothetical protein GUITHDRAFT_140053 [Guillardia theta CCMP2712]
MSDEGIRSGEVIGELCNVLTQFHQKVHANFNCCVWHAHEFLLDSANSNVIVADSLNGSPHGAYRWRPRSCTSHDWLIQFLTSTSTLQISQERSLDTLQHSGHSQALGLQCSSCASLRRQQLESDRTISELNKKLLLIENERTKSQEALARSEEEKTALKKEVSILKSKVLSDSKAKHTLAEKNGSDWKQQDLAANMGDWMNLRKEAELVIDGIKHERQQQHQLHHDGDAVQELMARMKMMEAEHNQRIAELKLQLEGNEKQVKNVVKYAIRLCTDAARCSKDSLAVLRNIVKELIPDDYDSMYYGNLMNSNVHLHNVETWSRSKAMISQVVSSTIENKNTVLVVQETLVSLLRPSEDVEVASSKKFLYPQADMAKPHDPSLSFGMQSIEITPPSGFAVSRALDGGLKVKTEGRRQHSALPPTRFHMAEDAIFEELEGAKEQRDRAASRRKAPAPSDTHDASLSPYDPTTSWRGGALQQETSSTGHPAWDQRSYGDESASSQPISSLTVGRVQEATSRTSAGGGGGGGEQERERVMGEVETSGGEAMAGTGVRASTARQIMKALSSGKNFTVKTQRAAGYDDLTLL